MREERAVSIMDQLVALILLCTLSRIQTRHVNQQVFMSVAELGHSLTLSCTVSETEYSLFYWYKMDLGYIPQIVAKASFDRIVLEVEFSGSRFHVTKLGGVYFLTIRNVIKEDEAIYFCQAGSAYTMVFVNATLLTVNDPENQQRLLRQTPAVETVPLGGSATLQCSLRVPANSGDGRCKHSVHWFKTGSESHPGIIYQGNITGNEDEERTCVYHLSKTMRDSSDAGIYYCAVATCGQILFAEGSKLEISQELLPHVIVLGVLLACSLSLGIFFVLKRNHKLVRGQKGKAAASSHAEQNIFDDGPLNPMDERQTEVNYVALDFSSRKVKRSSKKKAS